MYLHVIIVDVGHLDKKYIRYIPSFSLKLFGFIFLSRLKASKAFHETKIDPEVHVSFQSNPQRSWNWKPCKREKLKSHCYWYQIKLINKNELKNNEMNAFNDFVRFVDHLLELWPGRIPFNAFSEKMCLTAGQVFLVFVV